jgi:hypothetical protein
LGGQGEAAVQRHEEGGGGLEGENEAQAVLGVVLQVQLQGVLQEAPVAPSQLPQQRQCLCGRKLLKPQAAAVQAKVCFFFFLFYYMLFLSRGKVRLQTVCM